MKKTIIILSFIICLIFYVLNIKQVFGEYSGTELIETVANVEKEDLSVNAPSILCFDRSSKTVVYEKNGYEQRAMASTTKIMTAIIAIENGNLDDVVVVSKKAASINGSRLGLKAGDKITLENLLHGLLICSGNDAAIAIAEHIGGDEETFCNMMTQKAKELGAENTNFVIPHGLDNDEHYTTAYDLGIIADYAMDIPIFTKIVQLNYATVYINDTPKQIKNTNNLLGSVDGVDGIKTGFTNNAGRCIVLSATRNNWQLIFVVLGCDTTKQRTSDSIKFIDYCFNNYELVDLTELANQNHGIKDIKINKGEKEYIPTSIDDNIKILPLKKVDKDNLVFEYQIKDELIAPIAERKKIGECYVKIEGETICVIDIITRESVERKSEYDYFKEIIFEFGEYLKIKL